MPYSSLYKTIIARDTPTSKSRIRPRKVYKITGYEYADGDTKSFRGSNTVYVFVLGIFKGKLYALKITEIKPERFFKWLKTIMYQNLKEEDFHNLKWLENFIPKSDRAGTKLYNSFVKGKPIATKEPSTFRTYIIKNIKQISWIEFKLDVVEKFYGIRPSKDSQSKELRDQIEKAPLKSIPEPTSVNKPRILPPSNKTK